ncbi:MAG: methyl-accepting chemotaxis protein [Candidatus Omnitrophica bacterium]|nr:methyl-accepting chemotaxis protein [Candidatus Omnitrophota bacterium]MBU1853277.1 methyl-accepting chemotaxis protein [Candidatus Omnitrophota bacterium]
MAAELLFRRRRYIIKKGFQLRYIGIIFAVALLSSMVTGYTVFTTGWSLLGEKLANVYPQGRLLGVLQTTNLTLVKNLLLSSPLIFILGLLFSHKIAGPIFRIEKTLDDIAKGNLALRVRLRRGDELGDLADIINAMIEKLNNTVKLDKMVSSKIQKDLDAIRKIISSQSYDRTMLEASINDLQSNINELNSSLNKWDTGS